MKRDELARIVAGLHLESPLDGKPSLTAYDVTDKFLAALMELDDAALDKVDDVFHDEFQKQMKAGGKVALASGPFVERIWQATLTVIKDGKA